MVVQLYHVVITVAHFGQPPFWGCTNVWQIHKCNRSHVLTPNEMTVNLGWLPNPPVASRRGCWEHWRVNFGEIRCIETFLREELNKGRVILKIIQFRILNMNEIVILVHCLKNHDSEMCFANRGAHVTSTGEDKPPDWLSVYILWVFAFGSVWKGGGMWNLRLKRFKVAKLVIQPECNHWHSRQQYFSHKLSAPSEPSFRSLRGPPRQHFAITRLRLCLHPEIVVCRFAGPFWEITGYIWILSAMCMGISTNKELPDKTCKNWHQVIMGGLFRASETTGNSYWLVVWHMNFMTFHILGIIIPTDFHIFPRGRSTANQLMKSADFAPTGDSSAVTARSKFSLVLARSPMEELANRPSCNGTLWEFNPWKITIFTSSTAQGSGGSFKNGKPIGEIGCCESGMAERIHWWTERCLNVLEVSSLSLSFSDYLPTYQPIFYESMNLWIYLPIYLSTYLSVCLSVCLSVDLSICGAVSFSVM